MTNLTALKALAEAVEAGKWDSRCDEPGEETGLREWALIIDRIMDNGSLDAALALHDAVLPGWKWARTHGGEMLVWNYGVLRSRWGRSDIEPPSRALLLADIRALISQAEKGEA